MIEFYQDAQNPQAYCLLFNFINANKIFTKDLFK